jgi:hypothetical protein
MGEHSIVELNPKSRSRVTNGGRTFLFGDARTGVGRRLRDLTHELAEPLGGLSTLNESTRQLVQRAATLSIQAEILEAKAAAGEAINPVAYATVANSLTRILRKLEAKQPTPRAQTLDELVAEINAEQRGGT